MSRRHLASSPLPDAYRAIEPYSDSDCDLQLPHPERAYKIISSRIRVQGQNSCGSYYGRRAVYHILSHPAIRHVALALGSLCTQTEALITMSSEPMFTDDGLATTGQASYEMKDKTFCLDIRVFDSSKPFDRSQHCVWSPASFIVRGTILALLVYLSGSSDPAHLAAQGHILYLSSLAEREQFNLNCQQSSRACGEEDDPFSAEQAKNLSSKLFHLMRRLRALLLHNTLDNAWQSLEREEPGFKKAYIDILEQCERELDASIVDDLERLRTKLNKSDSDKLVLEGVEHLMSRKYPESGYNTNDPAVRSTVRSQTIAIFVNFHLDMEPDELAHLLPRVNRWYNDNIRPFLESFSARTGIADMEEESPAHLLANPRATVQPQHDPDVEQSLFAKDSLKIAQDPFALLYYGAYSGNLALVKRYKTLTSMVPSQSGSLAPILAAIEGENFSVINWLLVNYPCYKLYREIVLAAARAGSEVFEYAMAYMDLDALNSAFYHTWVQEDEQDYERINEPAGVVEALIKWLKNNVKKDASLYINAMGAAAAYKRWEDVMIFLRSDAVVHATFDDLDDALLETDEYTMQSIIERANRSGGVETQDMEGLCSLLHRVEGVLK